MEKNTGDLYNQILNRLSELENEERTAGYKADSFIDYSNKTSIKFEGIEEGPNMNLGKNDSKDQMIKSFLDGDDHFVEERDGEKRNKKHKKNSKKEEQKKNKKHKKNKKERKKNRNIDDKDVRKTRKLLKFMILIQIILLAILVYLLYIKICDSNLPLPFFNKSNFEVEDLTSKNKVEKDNKKQKAEDKNIKDDE